MTAQDRNLVQLCFYGKLKEVRDAIADGASVNRKGHRNSTCLIAAVVSCHWDIVSLLLEHPEIEVNAKDDNNQTAILIACEIGTIEVIRLLLARGANPNERGLNGDTCLMVAVGGRLTRHVEVVSLCWSSQISI